MNKSKIAIPTHFLSREQVTGLTGLSDEQLNAQMANGDFPEPESTREHPLGWHAHEVYDWILNSVDAIPGGA
jgi:predicted DNA-binding transcriptional regulator AlpA